MVRLTRIYTRGGDSGDEPDVTDGHPQNAAEQECIDALACHAEQPEQGQAQGHDTSSHDQSPMMDYGLAQ